jgi:O-antigen/teichoic acid export membrane protein
LALSLVGGICANVALLVAARPLLGLFGRAYADEVEWVLRVLVLGVFPATVKSHYVAVSQVKRRVSYAAMVISIAAVGELAGAALGATVAGLHGLTVAYVVALCIEAIVLAPTVLGTILSKRSV